MKLSLHLLKFAIAAAMTTLPLTGLAQLYTFDYTGDSFTDDAGFEYKVLTDGTVTVADPSFSVSGDVVIPGSVTHEGETYEVSGIADMGFGNAAITGVALPATIKIIGDYAFMGIGASTMELPEGIEIIGNSAFGYSSLSEVTLPQSLRGLDSYAFSGTQLTTLVIPDGVTTLSPYVVDGCYSLTSLTLPAGVKVIPSYCASYMSSLQELIIPEGIEEIGDYAFSGCDGLQTLQLPSTLKKVGISAFEGYSPEELTIPANIESLGQSAFASYSSTPMKKLTIADGETPLENSMSFGIRDVEELYIGRNLAEPIDCGLNSLVKLTTGGSMTRLEGFNVGVPVLAEVNLHEGLEYIGESCFHGSPMLTELTIPSTVTTLGNFALSEMPALETLTFADGETPINFVEVPLTYTYAKTLYIGREITGDKSYFQTIECTNLSLGQYVGTVDPTLFTEATKLAEITAYATEPPMLAEASFPASVYSKATLHTPEGSTRAYCDAEGWSNFRNIAGAVYTVKVSHNEGGTITIDNKADAEITVERNSRPVVNVTISEGYSLVSITFNGESLEPEGESMEVKTYILPEMRDDVDIVAEFSKNDALTAVAGESTSVNVEAQTITVGGCEGEMTVTTIDGTVVYTGAVGTVAVAAPGVYIVRAAGKSVKVAVN